ncbi:hypothetical protein T05_12516 [Trichinella murrelli]|uniref:Uncharacterized protein n=1 Tax=Trichinella murrelli TaxID=144512 RepID=A0A0V0UBX1_9BILA|nr:hypothetical protein T05_12516 [Trichinella murrelli]
MENPQFTVRSMIMRSLDEVEFLETNEIPLLHCCGKTTSPGRIKVFNDRNALSYYFAYALEAIRSNRVCCSIPNLKTMRITSDKVYPTEKKSAMPTNNNQLQQYNIILSPVSALSNMLSVLVVMIIIHVDLGAS